MNEPLSTKRVWDLPTRLFHWALTTCVLGSIVTAKLGGSAMEWHFRCGYVVFTLLLFRLLWGLIGGHWSRFSRFIYSPAAVLRYLQRQSRPDEHHNVGHSPLGALSVFALLSILALQVASGLVADDEIATSGPLVALVSDDISSWATSWHNTWGQWIVISLIALHVAAIAFYLAVRRRNLVHAMVLGDKPLPAHVPTSVDGWATRALAAAALLVCAAAVGWVINLGAS